MKYLNAEVPDFYKCSVCSSTGIKLWRDYNTVLSAQTLMCAPVAMKNQGIDISTMTSDGRFKSDDIHHYTDSIGWKVPAVPTEDESTYWGYFSVPMAGVLWWKNLPNKQNQR